MKFGVIVFPGSNCDQDMIYTLRNVLGHEVVELWHKETDLQNVDFIVLPGGFSYGDYLRSGAIAQFSPIMEKVQEFASNGGFVLGVCNGFQVLCEAGLLPGTLMHNDSHSFICENVYLKSANKGNFMTAGLDSSKAYKIPIAHGEGKYFADPEVLEQMESNDQILFYYSDKNAEVTPKANPNGSTKSIAGVCNASKNVFGMMPHPERAADENLGNLDGKEIFEAMLKEILATAK